MPKHARLCNRLNITRSGGDPLPDVDAGPGHIVVATNWWWQWQTRSLCPSRVPYAALETPKEPPDTLTVVRELVE